MKKKTIGIFFSILMISTIVIPAAAITERSEIATISNDADVPIWKEGYYWTYHFYETSSFPIAYFLTGDLTFNVVDDSGDSYIIEALTRPTGAFDLGGYGLKATKFTKFFMRLKIRKSDLGLESFNENIKGILFIKIGSITLPIPLQVEANLDVECDPTWPFIPFPLYDGKYGLISGTEFTHTNYYISLFWGLVPVDRSPLVSWPITPLTYTCSEEQITIDHRTFDVFNVSAEWIDGSRFESYYCEEVGNVAKEEIYIHYGGGLVRYALTLELKDWSCGVMHNK